MSICLAIVGDERNPSSSGLEHTPTGLIQRSLWINGNCLGRRNAQCLFHLCVAVSVQSACRGRGIPVPRTSKVIQAELVDLIQSCGVLEVILDDIDVIRRSQKAGEGGRLGIP